MKSSTFKVLLLVALCTAAGSVFAQITIDYPLDRCILQRDKNNRADVRIAGSFSKQIDKVEVLFKVRNGGQSSDWMTLQNNPAGGYYEGTINWVAGWYEIEVRGKLGESIVGTAVLGRFGIGEVFLVAGQSNAQGYLDYGAPGAGDDRVNCFSYYNINDPGDALPYPNFTPLFSGSYIAPRGNSAWAWGKLGDLVASRLNVPVLFYNIGWYGSAIRNWRESINGSSLSVYGAWFEPSGMPYGNLRLTVQNYVALTGVRAVLWLQGEADTYANTSKDSYVNDLKAIISQSRNDSGRNISWVISRTSRYSGGGTSSQVINAQNEVVASTDNVFYGPETDAIQQGRADDLHFSGDGLSVLAEAWSNHLNDSFFANSQPQSPISLPGISVSCSGGGLVTIKYSGDYSSASWNNGGSDRQITVGNGSYRVKLRDGHGNVIYSPLVKIESEIQPAKPSVVLESGNMICQSSSLPLSSSYPGNSIWSNGQTGDRIYVSQAGSYSLKARSVYGCEASSDPVDIGLFSTPPPAKPTIAVSGATTFCFGGEVNLVSSSGARSEWSDGFKGATLAAKTSSSYSVRATDANGCYSVPSDPVNVTVHNLPAKPVIAANRSLELCQGQEVELTSSYTSGITWSNGSSVAMIKVNSAGSFTVKVKDANGCESSSEPSTVIVNALPAAPVISNLLPVSFCNGEYTRLQANQQYKYLWSNGATQREVEIRASGSYSVQAIDQKGCQSVASPVVIIQVNPIPAVPVVTALGSTTFCGDTSVVLQSSEANAYNWNTQATVREVKITKSGSYSVQAVSAFGCKSPFSASVDVHVKPIPDSPTIQINGETEFCFGGVVDLVARSSLGVLWNTGSQDKELVVGSSGTYFVRAVGANGCRSFASSAVSVNVRPNPSVPELKRDGLYGIVNLATPANWFHWEGPDGAKVDGPSKLIKVVKPGYWKGTAYMRYASGLECASEESDGYLFSPDVENEENELVLYPNPETTGTLYIEAFRDFKEVAVSLFDTRGVLLKSYGKLSLQNRVALTLPADCQGVCLVRIIADGKEIQRKIIVRK